MRLVIDGWNMLTIRTVFAPFGEARNFLLKPEEHIRIFADA